MYSSDHSVLHGYTKRPTQFFGVFSVLFRWWLLLNAAAAAGCCARVKTQRWYASRQQLIVENFVRNKSLLCFVLFSCFFSESCFTNVIVLSFIEIYKVRHHLFNHSWIPDTDVILFFLSTLLFLRHT